MIRLRLRSQPVLNLFCLLPSIHQRVLTLGISRAVLASRPVCFLAVKVRATFPHPGSHACATELVSAIALRVAARFRRLDRGVAVGTDFEGFACLSFCGAVNGVQAKAIFGAALVGVLWAVAIDADNEVTVSAGEDAAVFLTVERLSDPGATGHAHNAVLELFGVPGQGGSVNVYACLCVPEGLPVRCSPASEFSDVLSIHLGIAEHALNLVWSLLFDLKAKPGFPAFSARAVSGIMDMIIALRGDSQGGA